MYLYSGKSIENTRNRLECKLLSSVEKLAHYQRQPNYKSYKIINEDLVAVFLTAKIAQLKKPFAVGVTILELSKLLLYQEFYGVLYPNFENLEVLMSDTDSFIFKSTNIPNIEDKLSKLKNHFDFSNLPPTNKLYDQTNKNQLYRWKLGISKFYFL